MQKNYLLFFLLGVFFYNSYGQGSPTCANAQPFCASAAGSGLTFSNTVGNPNPSSGGVDYGCLERHPNPAWFYMQIGTAGDLYFRISQKNTGGTPIDVDFIAWGPFLEPSCGPLNLNASTQIACSYSASATENFTINGAQVGAYYMVMITNFSGAAGNISLTQLPGSSGSTNCDILCPLSIAGGDVPVCEGAKLTAQYVNSIQPTFQWYLNDQLIPGATSISYTPTVSGTYSVVANSPGCAPNQKASAIVPDPTPIAINLPKNPLLACTFSPFDLTANTSIILSGLTVSNFVVKYHTTLIGAQNNDNSIPDPSSYNGTTDEIIYVSIRDLLNLGCITTSQFRLKALPCGPTPIKPDDLFLCDDDSKDGIETFDLSKQDVTIMGANDPAKYTLTYHLSIEDAQGDVNPISGVNTYANITNPQKIYIRLEENATPTNYGTDDFQLIVSQKAIVNVVSSTICASVKAETDIPGTYSYQWTVPSGASPVGNVSNFITSFPGVYSVIVTDTQTGCISPSASGYVSDSTYPTVTVNSPEICVGTNATVIATPGTFGTYIYDWTVPSGVSPPGNVASFQTTTPGEYKVKITNELSSCVSANAIGTVSHIPLPTVTVNSQTICFGETATITATPETQDNIYNYSWTGPSGFAVGNVPSFQTTIAGTYTVRITNRITNCISESVSGIVTVKQLPGVNVTVTDSTICSGQIAEIQLSKLISNTVFTWTVDQSGVTGASDGTGNVISQFLTATGDSVGTAVYTITPTTNSCIGLPTIVTITVTPIPVATATVSNQTICSETKTTIALSSTVAGTTFSWTVVQDRVIGAIGGTGNIIEQQLRAISVTPGEVVYTIFPMVGDCIGNPITVTVTVSPNPEIFGFATNYICDGDSTNIILSPNVSDTTLEWTVVQTNVTGASDGAGEIIDQVLTNTGTVDGTVVYTVTPTANGCVGKPIEVTIIVKSLPTLEITGGIICVNENTDIALQTYTLETGLSESDYEFVWYLDSVLIENAEDSSYEATQSGEYSVKVTDISTGCTSKLFSATVVDAFIGQTVSAEVNDAFSDNPTIKVTVIGGSVEFVYQLDNGTPQSSNVFSPVSLGTHIVTVTDVNSCTNLATEVVVIGYPNYFTPNGDGIHDTWNIIGLDNQSKAKVFIYDRFGKLMTQIVTNGKGWDGTYNGILMPSTDYWFTIDYVENGVNKIFKSHFSLKIN